MPTTPGRAGNRPGPKPRLTREAVVEAAIEVGAERLSIAAVAERLGVAPGTLYRYVDGLEEIASAAVAQVFARTPLPDARRGWRPFLEAEAALLFDLLVSYSGLVRDLGTDLGTVAGDRVRRIVATLSGAGFGPTAAVRVAGSVVGIAMDGAHTTRRVRGPDGGPGDLSAPAQAYLATLEEPVRTEMAALMTDPRHHVLDKVALLLDGVEHRRAVGRPGYAGIR